MKVFVFPKIWPNRMIEYMNDEWPDEHTNPAITPAMVDAGLQVLRNWSGLEHPALADAKVVRAILEAALCRKPRT